MSSVYIPVAIRERVAASARYRCGYCLSPQKYVMDELEYDHLHPRSLGGLTIESNLWLACGLCNRRKHNQISAIDDETGIEAFLFNPRIQFWPEHFSWDETGIFIIGLTPFGRTTVKALKLNNPIALRVRRHWVTAGWHPPQD